MKVSIITVCKDAVKSTERTLVSLYGQTYKDIEHIVIDGGSTDGTLEILSKYRDNISVLISEPDSGIYNAMNKAIKLATGDLVYFLNATDTFYDENVLKKAVDEFKKHPDLELLWGDVQFVKDNKEIRIATFENINVKSDLIYNNPCHQSMFYKNEIFVKYGDYNENLPIYADYEFNVRMLVHHNVRCKYIPEVLARFELGGVSTSSDEKIKLRQKQERVQIYKEHFRNNLHYRLDKFFTKVFGTPTAYVKNTRLWNILFATYDKVLRLVLKQQLTLNKIKT